MLNSEYSAFDIQHSTFQRLRACAGSSGISATSRSFRSSSTACAGWNIGATTRPAWRWCATAQIELRRSAGKLARLEEVLAGNPLEGDYGIGHTRWATHGRPTEENAHPHRDCTGRIVVVHNGIIENYLDLKRQLQKEGHTFVTETDTEIVAHLVERESRGDGLENAVRRALLYMRGLFALVLISADDPNKIVTVRNGPPIVVGLGEKEFFVASDIPAILAHTRDVVFLGDEEMAVITPSGVEFTDYSGRAVSKKSTRVMWDPDQRREGGIQALHAQGDLRAADGDQGDGPRPRVGRERPGVPAGNRDPRPGAARRRAGRDPGLRHLVAFGAGRQVPDRVAGARAGRRRLRLRVSLSRSDRVEEHAGDRHHAVGRDRRHARGAARGEEEGRAQHLDLQRRRQHGDARDRRDGLHARGAGDRRRVHQGVHDAAGRAAPAGALHGADPRHADAG